MSDSFKPLNGNSIFNQITIAQTETLHMHIKLASSSVVAQSFIVVSACVATPSVAMADAIGVSAWGMNSNNQGTIPASADSGVSAIAGGRYHTIALKDGAVLAWGYNNSGQCNIPVAAQSGVIAIAGGNIHTVALKGGAVLAWGANWDGQSTIPASANSGVSAIAGGGYHTIALSTDCNVNGVSDGAEFTQDPTLDANLNGKLDSCEIAENPSIDSNQNGIPNSVDLAAPNGLLATANAQVAALTTRLNCGDLNGDGEVNGADLGRMLISWGQCQ